MALLKTGNQKPDDSGVSAHRNHAAAVSKLVRPAPPENPVPPEDDLAATPGALIIRRS